MRSQNRIQAIELIVVVGILPFAYLPDLNDVEFHPDESRWIGTSGAFESYLRMELDSPVWAPSYWTLIQPPVARYVIGLGRYAGGYRRPELNRPWDFRKACLLYLAGACFNQPILYPTSQKSHGGIVSVIL